ncbi:MAG: hypothetical protein HY007_00870 [Candidatus Sungbacteria bacterium]|nr:hypothetical protein [Candidatus Sungbacteria bacterium]
MATQKHKAAYVIGCFDPEVRKLETIFNERFGGQENYFYVPEPGGVYYLARPCYSLLDIVRNPIMRWSITNKIRKARSVYYFDTILLVNHSYCRMYANLKTNWSEDAPSVQQDLHEEELLLAETFLKKYFSGMQVERHYFSTEKQELIF